MSASHPRSGRVGPLDRWLVNLAPERQAKSESSASSSAQQPNWNPEDRRHMKQLRGIFIPSANAVRRQQFSKTMRDGWDAGHVFANHESQFLRRVKAAMVQVSVEKYGILVNDSAPDVQTNVAYLFNLPCQPDRKWQPCLAALKTEYNGVTCHRWVFGARDGDAYRYFGTRDISEGYGRELAGHINDVLVRLLNGWIGSTFEGISAGRVPHYFTTTVLQETILRAAEVHVDSSLPLKIPRGTFHQHNDLHHGHVRLVKSVLFDPVNLSSYQVWFTIPTASISNWSRSRGPSHVQLSGRMETHQVCVWDTVVNNTTGERRVESLVPAHLNDHEQYRPLLKQAEDLGDLLALEAYGLIISMHDFRVWLRSWLAARRIGEYMPQDQTAFSGHSLVELRQPLVGRTRILQPSVLLTDAMRTQLPTIIVRTTARARVLSIMDAIMQNFNVRKDIRTAWLAGAYYADAVSQDIHHDVPVSVRCNCNNVTMGYIVHHCAGLCGKLDTCVSLPTTSYGMPICDSCLLTADEDELRFD